MFERLLKPLKSNSLFVFGARGTGKSTWVKNHFKVAPEAYIDLLDDDLLDRLRLSSKIIDRLAESGEHEWIVIDEVQRLPKLLNQVHKLIESKRQRFVLTGSSSRKLKRGGANLLAGRGFVNTLFPLTFEEIGERFDLQNALHWGTLPKLFELENDDERAAYLRSYCLTYIKEEIQGEQVVRKLEPFRGFLEIAAQTSGKIVNFANIAREVGVHIPTVQTYFQILEDTYLGFTLPHYHRSVRKSQLHAPKFYLFDSGVRRSLESALRSAPVPGTSYYGELFESFVIQEIMRINTYCHLDYKLAYFRTKNEAEVDLVLSRGRKTMVLEIKSSIRIDEVSVGKLARLATGFGSGVEAFYLSQDPRPETINGVKCLPWQKFLMRLKKQ
jgi:uncharacterized protein